MITKTSSTLTNLKNLFIEIFLDKTVKVSNVADGSVVNATAFGVAKIAQKAMKDIAIKEAQIFPESATGEYLDRAAALYGVSPRKGSLGSSTYIRVYANPGTIYDENVTFINSNGIRFAVDEALTVDSSGYGYVKVRSVNAGYSTNVEPNSIVQVSPQPDGHIECTNEYYAMGGRDSEDDETFRIRIQNNLNILSKSTIEYWTQVFQNLDDRILKVMSAGLDEEGRYVIYLATQNGIWLTDDELDSLLQQAQGYFGLSELNMDGDVTGIVLKNIDWFYVGSERGMDFRVRLDPDYNVATVRKNIQVNLTKYLDWRFWEPGTIIEWDDLFDIVKKSEGVKYVPDEYFFPYYDQEVPVNELPRIRGFVMRDEDGNILFDAGSNLSSLFYPASNDDLFTGLNDSSLSLTHSAYFNVIDEDGNPLEGARITIDLNSILTDSNGQGVITLENGSYSYTVTLDRYNSVSGTFTVLNGAVTIDVTMVLAPYTVSFNVVDEDGSPLPNVTITTNNRSLVTNSNGQASIALQTGEYEYQAILLGYDTITNGTFEVEEHNTTVFIRMYLTTWNVSLFVLDTRNQPVVSAIVQLGSNSYLTDQEGKVAIQLVNGDYSISISKVGYVTNQQSFTVLNMDQTYSFVIQSFEYNVTVHVVRETDKTNLQNVSISIANSSISGVTDENGNFTFKAINGNYSLTASYPYYDNSTTSFNVENEDTTVELEMVLKHYNNIFQVQNEDNQPIGGAQISINNSIYTTEDTGRISIPLQNGSYPYTIRRAGYENYTGTLSVYGADTNTAVMMNYILYNIEFTVKGKDSALINGAQISIDSTVITTNEQGIATINLRNGSYEYTVTADEYNQYEGQITVNGANVQEEVELQEKTYSVTILVTNQNNGMAVQGATVTINQTEQTTNDSGIANFSLPNGTYNYIVNRAGFTVANGEFQVLNQNVTYPVQLTPIAFSITFSVKDDTPSAAPVEGVTVQVGDSYMLQTGSDGTVTNTIYAGEYDVTFTKEGYQTATQHITVSAKETFEQVIKKIYNLSFNVTAAEGGALQNVEINVTGVAVIGGSQTVTSKEDGTTDSIQVINGAYSYGAYLSGYSPEEGSGMIENADKVQSIDLVFGIETTFFAQEGSTPIEGVSITIDTTQTVQTAANGQITVNLSNGQHSYTYSKTGYISGSGTVTVNNEEQTVNIALVTGAKTSITITDNSGPVNDAHITFEDEDGNKYEGDTDEDGRVDINLPNGDYTVTVEKDGYEDWTGETTVDGSDIDLPIDLTDYKYWSGEVIITTYVGIVGINSPSEQISMSDEILSNITITATKGEKRTTVGTWGTKTIGGVENIPVFTFSQLTNGTWDLSIEAPEGYWWNHSLNLKFGSASNLSDVDIIKINNSSSLIQLSEERTTLENIIFIWSYFKNISITVKDPEEGNVQNTSIVGNYGMFSEIVPSFIGTTNVQGIATVAYQDPITNFVPSDGLLGMIKNVDINEDARSINTYMFEATPPSPYQLLTNQYFVLSQDNQNTTVTVESTYDVTFNITSDESGTTLRSGSTVTCTPTGGGNPVVGTISNNTVTLALSANQNYNYVVSCGIQKVTTLQGCFSEVTGQTGNITENKTIPVTVKMFKTIPISATGYGLSSGNVSLSVSGGASGSSTTLSVSITGSASNYYFPQSTSYYILIPSYPSNTVGSISDFAINAMTFSGTVTMQVYQTYTYSVAVRRANSTNGISSVQMTLSSSSRGYSQSKTGTSLLFADVPYGTDYTLSCSQGTYWKAYSSSGLSITSNSSNSVSLLPLYNVIVNTGQPSCSVTFIDSDGQKHTGTSNSSAQITFSSIPAGNYSVSVSKSGFTTNSDTGTLLRTNALEQTIDCLVIAQPKLVQITSNQSNYQLDTSYKYISMLVVGPGGNGSPGNYGESDWRENVYIGEGCFNGSGEVIYLKSIPINLLEGFMEIDFATNVTSFEFPIMSENTYTSAKTTESLDYASGVGAPVKKTDVGIFFYDYLVNAASNGGDWSCNTDSTNQKSYCGQGGGMNGNGGFGKNEIENGGDGHGGYSAQGGNYSYQWGNKLNENIIPLQSIFEGTGKGGIRQVVLQNSIYYYTGGGGGGYGDGLQDGQFNAGYGAGGTRLYVNGNYWKGGPGIVVLYYHDNPL